MGGINTLTNILWSITKLIGVIVLLTVIIAILWKIGSITLTFMMMTSAGGGT